MPTVEDLKKQILFDGLSDEEVAKLLPNIQKVTVVKNNFVFKEGDSTTGIYMIHSGRIEVKRKLQLDTKSKMLVMLRNIQSEEIKHTADGWETRFALLSKGQHFGELSILEGKKKHGAEAVALEDTELFILKTENFMELETTATETMVKIMKAIARVMSTNVRALDKRILKALTGQ
ncbi:Crp/Fnr family transcriptional regulator [Candidatus Magnetominusculus dajiuhuensis]|uniref:Crp/Fnr family transcriptional regulator n=1 Tax=Candidatus Magnetominusculus dajiuhuensis TaxID=3137712 RepID=UPI003B4359AB